MAINAERVMSNTRIAKNEQGLGAPVQRVTCKFLGGKKAQLNMTGMAIPRATVMT